MDNSHKLITNLNEEYNKLKKEYNDIEKYVIDLEEENKGYKSLIDEVTKSHDIHKTLLLKNENFRDKVIKKKKKIQNLKNLLVKKDSDIKLLAKELSDKNSIIEDFQLKIDELDKLLETKDVLLNTSEVTNTELKTKVRLLEKEKQDLIKKLNDELLNKRLDFEEIIKQSIEALKIFYANFENTVLSNEKQNTYFSIYDGNKIDNMNNNNFYFNLENHEQRVFNSNNNINHQKGINSGSNAKIMKNGFNTVTYNDEEYELKSISSKVDRINRSLSPIGKRENYNSNNNNLSKSNTKNNSKEKMYMSKLNKRSKSFTENPSLNLGKISFLQNDIFNFKEYFEKLSDELSLLKNNNSYNNNNSSLGYTLNHNNNNANKSLIDKDKNPKELNYPLKIVIEQALEYPINSKISEKNIIRGNLQAFNFYFNFLKSELFSSLLRERNIAHLIKQKLTPILQEYGDDNVQNNLNNSMKNLRKNLLDKVVQNMNNLKNRIEKEALEKNNLIQELKNLQLDKQRLSNQLDEVESNLLGLNSLYNQNVDKLFNKIHQFRDLKENADKELLIITNDFAELNSKHQSLIESFNELKQNYSNAIGENEELNKELIDLKQRMQKKQEQGNFSSNYILTTEENFSFKGNGNSRIEYYSNNLAEPYYGNKGYVNSSEEALINNYTLPQQKEMQLMKENFSLKQEIKKLAIEKDNLKYHLSKLDQTLDSKLDRNINSNLNFLKTFEANSLYIRRASEVYYLAGYFNANRLNTNNTFEYSTYSNNNMNNMNMFTSLDYNNYLLREDEYNKKIYSLELDNTKLNNQITALLEKNQALELKLTKLLAKLGRFSTRGLSIHNNIRFNLDRSEEHVFKKNLLEKNEEINFKYNIPTINYNNQVSSGNRGNLDEADSGVCATCKAQYQEIKALRSVIKTNTFKELKAFYISLCVDLNKISNKIENIIENFAKTTACFETEPDITQSHSHNSNTNNLNRTVKFTQVKEILLTLSKMIGVCGHTIKKYQKDINIYTGSLERIFEFIYRIVFSTLIYNEKLRTKIRDSKSLNSNNTNNNNNNTTSKIFDDENNNSNNNNIIKKCLANANTISDFIGKFEHYYNTFNKIHLSIYESENFFKKNNSLDDLKALYSNKTLNEIVEVYGNVAYGQIREDSNFTGRGNNNNNNINNGEAESNNYTNSNYNFHYKANQENFEEGK